MSEEGQDLIARLEVLSARLDAMVAQPLAGPRDQRPQLHATPQGLQVLKETVARLLASGDLWWSDAQRKETEL
jgi:hypothetical protein